MTGRSAFEIPREELVARATRSSGAGGQHVNKTSSRIQLSWNVATSAALDDPQRDRLLHKLSSRLTADGTLTVTVSDTRSQYRNREIAEERLEEVVRAALVVPKKRKPTKPTRAAKEKRLDSKKLHSKKKKNRRADSLD
ncbi:MAG: aminoacyl-tRNA hydrolase [Gemmatimonadaceae bacterium]|nr:aminoacyl-tRNA hydrolase [Gemmatimonadaceae bacterium]